jgi:hypothetical protein
MNIDILNAYCGRVLDMLGSMIDTVLVLCWWGSFLSRLLASSDAEVPDAP